MIPFPSDWLKNTSQLYDPKCLYPRNLVQSVIQGIKKIIPGLYQELMDCISQPYDLHKNCQEICNHLGNYTIHWYKVEKHPTFSEIVLDSMIGEKQPNNHDIHLMYYARNIGTILKLDAFRKRFRCSTCFRWRPAVDKPTFIREHYNYCMMCSCHQSYLSKPDHPSSDHPAKCKKVVELNKDNKPQKEECKTYKVSRNKKKDYYEHNVHSHHADFETFPIHGDMVVDSCGLWVSSENENVRNDDETKIHLWCGKKALDEFMDYCIENLKGVLWFFNGGRFDDFFILNYCIRNAILIDKQKTLLSSGKITVVTLPTKKGFLEIKDAQRFFAGSLAFNCQGMGLDKKYWKGDFEHHKVNSWEDVEKYKEKRLKYLRQDVIAQQKVYDIGAKAFFDDYKLNITPFVSISQYAFAAFTTTLKKKHLLFKTPRKDEAAMREAYRGGRIIMTRPYWLSNDFDNIMKYYGNGGKLAKCFTECQSYLIYLDANSLYPTVMSGHKYPCGKTEYCPLGDGKDQHLKMLFHLGTGGKPKKSIHVKTLLEQRLWQVDVECPKDIYIAFLMGRTKDGRNIQDLKPKIKTWYTGPELLEAVKLGYKITKIHAYYQWEDYQEVFTDFIQKAWDRKAKSIRDTAPYTISKMMMNALSGKFGQKVCDEVTHLIIGSELDTQNLVGKVTNLIYSADEDEVLAAIVKEKLIKETSNYPIHFSTFILGRSKVHMSRFFRKSGAYWNPLFVAVYGDTDSVIIPYDAIKDMDKKYFGKELGQMKDEMDDSKIIGM